MSIKSLLLGSAAALVAVSGASAADAVVAAEPEPMEYVRVCDAYGAGYFYIPGTETCLKIGGWVRYEIFWATGSTGFDKQARGRLEFEAKNESDLGTVSSYFRIEHGHRSWTAPMMYSDAQYSLGVGGLEMGYRDSQWNRFSGYGGVTDWGGSYGYQTRHYISYTFTSGNFSGILSLDHDNNVNYMPDVMAGVAGTFGKVNATLSAGYDESDASVALKATVNAPVGPATLRLVGLWTNSATNAYAWDWTLHGSWSIIAGISAPLGSRASVGLDFQYFQDGHYDIYGNLGYTIAPGLTALAEVAHFWNNTNAFMLRFERSF
ncbi:MAG: porin [Rhizobiaceae bacterium]